MGAATSRSDAGRYDEWVKLRLPLAASVVEADEGAVNDGAESAADATPPKKADKVESLTSFSSVVDAAGGGAGVGKGRWWWLPSRGDLPNPGSYDEMAQDAQVILRTSFIEGLSFNMTIPQTAHLANGVAFDLGSKQAPGSFALLTNYYTNALVAMTRLSPADGHVNGRIFYRHTPAATSKIFGDVALGELMQSKLSWEVDYRGSSYVGQLKLANGGGGLVCALSWLQSVTSGLAVGGEAFYQTRSAFHALTLAGKYTRGKDTATLSVATFGPLFATFARKVSSKCTLATELFLDTRTRDSHVALGYRFDLRSATCTGIVDSTGKVAATVEEKINPGFSLILSGELDHQKEDYKFGIGVNFGQ